MHLGRGSEWADIGREGRTVFSTIPDTPKFAAVEEIVATIGDLPSSPAIVSAVIGLASDLNTRLAEIGRVLSADQGMTAKVLRLSNSSYYGRTKQIATVEQAVITLGYYTVRSLVVASGTRSAFCQRDPARFLPVLWEHSLGSAVAARLLGRRIGHSQAEEAFIGGLLHDVGKLVLTEKLQAGFKALRADAESDGDWCRAERIALGFTHVDVGVALLEKWNFPRTLVEAVALHHTSPKFVADHPPTLPALIWLANQIARQLVSTTETTQVLDWTNCFARAGIPWSTEEIAAFLAQFDEQLTQARWFFAAEE